MVRSSIPKLRHHKHKNAAYVELGGKRIYLGRWGTPEAEQRYHAKLAEWTSSGKQHPVPQHDITVVELLARFWEHAQGYYVRRDGTPTHQLSRVKSAAQAVTDLYAEVPAVAFGPMKLRAVRDTLIDRRLARSNINAMISCVKLAFKWAASHEMIPGSVVADLGTLEGLRYGRSLAKETEPVAPVLEAHIEAVRPHLSTPVAAMINLQLLTGARPGEIVQLRSTDFDRTGKVWTAHIASHKNAYRRKERVLYFGPKAQEILRPYLMQRPVGDYLFSPREAERERYQKCGVHRRENQKPNERATVRVVGACYTTQSYGRAIVRACGKAGIPPWSPNQLRHNAGTRLRQEYGLDAAAVVLGHARCDVTQVYAEMNTSKAVDIIGVIG